jgi:hypothetical protein
MARAKAPIKHLKFQVVLSGYCKDCKKDVSFIMDMDELGLLISNETTTPLLSGLTNILYTNHICKSGKFLENKEETKDV